MVTAVNRRHQHRIGVLGLWFIASLLCGNWFGTSLALWMLWTGLPVLLLLGMVARFRRPRGRLPHRH